MKKLFIQYKPFFSFLIKFLLFYVVFAFLYSYYLNQYESENNEVDGITQLVSKHTNSILIFFGHHAEISQNETEPSIKLIYQGKYVARIIEGCNGISVMILFAAFVFAFSFTVKRTIIYILLGCLIIYVLNISRIAMISYALYYYPKYNELLHGTIFPLFIYGVVFLLWVLWVTKFSGYDKKVA